MLRDRIRGLSGQTRTEQAAFRNAISLFFGALLGTNLDAFADASLKTYIAVIMLLAAVVMAFQLLGQARSRGYSLALLASYGGLLAYAYWQARLFDGIAEDAVQRLFATLAVWLGAIAVIELTPVLPNRGSGSEQRDRP